MAGPKRVMVVDDDDFVRFFVEEALTDRGYEVIEARNGAVALSLLGSVQPDLILLDMRMPVMDGWQFAATYRVSHPGPHAPIVVVTAAADAATYAAQIQAQAHLSKPFAVDDLFDCVAHHVGSAQ